MISARSSAHPSCSHWQSLIASCSSIQRQASMLRWFRYSIFLLCVIFIFETEVLTCTFAAMCAVPCNSSAIYHLLWLAWRWRDSFSQIQEQSWPHIIWPSWRWMVVATTTRTFRYHTFLRWSTWQVSVSMVFINLYSDVESCLKLHYTRRIRLDWRASQSRSEYILISLDNIPSGKSISFLQSCDYTTTYTEVCRSNESLQSSVCVLVWCDCHSEYSVKESVEHTKPVGIAVKS